MMGPRRCWPAPPPMDDRWGRAAYFAGWSPAFLPRRGYARPNGGRRYEVRMMMSGLAFTIDDDLSCVADVDVQGLLALVEARMAIGDHGHDRFEDEELFWYWLRRALTELVYRSSAQPPGTPIAREDWHQRDLERMRRVAGKMANYLLLSLDGDPA